MKLAWSTRLDGPRRHEAYSLAGKVSLRRGMRPWVGSGSGKIPEMGWLVYVGTQPAGWQAYEDEAKRFAEQYVYDQLALRKANNA